MLEHLADATWRNPIFMLVFFGAIWYLPGIVIRRMAEKKAKANKERVQSEKIARLYPRE
ncbi:MULTISPECIES: hypothetical protein [Prochlorococcus]|uniref:hypothetical protein n=1 Tax=Prochlorococcus TaxID=1218 RepID=UPI000533B7F9|nr:MULTISPECIES: hypothetical protein [Prochlorococcus]KGG12531.1 hypothetical protein EV05_1743 [Prochlorococcus sp. MIT 0601]